MFHPSMQAASALAVCAALTACGGGGGDDPVRLSAATGAPLFGSCADLAPRLSTLANTTITAVNSVPAGSLTVAGQPIAAHCQVLGKMFSRTSAVDGNAYAIGFEMRLPLAWNGRFYHQGNGGIDGAVVPATGPVNGGGALTNALQQGFAVLSSDAGHAGALGPNFGIDPQARLDYGYQAVAKLTPMAKSVISAAYTKGPDRSYFGGCSNGGRHAMIAATRYATDYDGILAGSPGYNLPKAAIASIAGGQLYASVATNPADLSTAFTTAERALLGASVLAKCDALDGATDGLIQDVAACQAAFDLQRDVPTCTGARDGTCLSAAQKTVIGKIFSGPTTSNGALIYSSFPYDSGVSGSGIPFWEFISPLALDSGAVGLIFKTPPENASGFNGPAFTLSANLDTLVAQIFATNALYTESGMSFMTPPNPTDMSVLNKRGGKIILYHGVADPIFSVNDSQAWYKGLQANNGGDASGFARFYRVPGMGHCSGGPATDQFDALTPLVNWVEKGIAPDAIVAQARGAGNAGGVNPDVPAGWAADRTRPLCPYPKVARYNGSGSLELASSFSCK
ncbi:tannase/feruloyl esterase family alpha/beta hydrolase [Caenimonas terrae]|uniref:Tannase/feruloyl esterase family alpha/beta hydrolase n=1 Tax=Caenimonas terrae TaxID=696074 RepID=A0ABW0NKC2_9BURK